MSSIQHNGDKHNTETPDVSHIRNVEVTHERSDINIAGVFTFVIALTVAAIIIHVGIWLLFDYYQSLEEKEPKPGPMALTRQERLPPAPRLQAAPGFAVTLENGQAVDLQLREPQAEYLELRNQWQQVLQQGPRDSRGNSVGLPISEAMKKVITSDAVKARQGSSPGRLIDFGIKQPTAWSSGRTTENRVR
ncbi:MAG: hypothetical protein ABR555_03170 [Pyrinomonadaceae bacterium]